MSKNDIEINILILESEMADYYKKINKLFTHMCPIFKNSSKKKMRRCYLQKKESLNLDNYDDVAKLLIGSKESKADAITHAFNHFIVNELWRDELIKLIN